MAVDETEMHAAIAEVLSMTLEDFETASQMARLAMHNG
jgi:hypothetical protein